MLWQFYFNEDHKLLAGGSGSDFYLSHGSYEKMSYILIRNSKE